MHDIGMGRGLHGARWQAASGLNHMTSDRTHMNDLLAQTLREMTKHAAKAKPGYAKRSRNDPVLYHLRPTSAGITVVSTSLQQPQMGFVPKVWTDAEHIIWEDLTEGPARATPEKQVQAHLIATALTDDRRLPAALAPAGCTLHFLVDELVVQDQPGAGGSRRGDIIAVCEDTQGSIRPAFVELKSERNAKTLQEQVSIMHTSFWHGPASQQRLDALHAFAVAVLGRDLPKWSTSAPRSVGVLVWPWTNSPHRQTPFDIQGNSDIQTVVVGYRDITYERETPVAP